MTNTRRAMSFAAATLLTTTVVVSCGATGTTPSGPVATSSTATESNSAGDIPDTQAYVAFSPPGSPFTVSVPEGWARSSDGTATVFTDKLNTIRIETQPRSSAPNTQSATVEELPAIATVTKDYRPGTVTAVQRTAGPAILITYQGTSPPNPVTSRTTTDAFERYEFWRNGREVVLTLSGPVGADNVDPWRTITDSLRWQ